MYKNLIKKEKKLNIKAIILTCLISLAFLPILIPINANAGIGDILVEGVSILLICIGDALKWIAEEIGGSIDSLIFNTGGNPLTLLKGTDNSLTFNIFKMYNLFVYLAGSLMGIIVLFSAFDFLKTADNINHKIVLKDRLKKIVVTMILLLCMPTILDIMLDINQALIDIFKTFIEKNIASISSTFDKPFLMEEIKNLAKEDGDGQVVLSIIYVISGVLNIWLCVFYILRDIGISLLFIISPIIVILLPYNKELVMKWAKELISNIFTQAIQAFILTLVFSIAKSLALAEDATLYDQIFTLVAFAMFIPFTSQIKRLLGLEGEIGAAKSNAGVGGVMASAAIAGMAVKGAVGFGKKVKGSIDDRNNIVAEQQLSEKSVNDVGTSNNANQEMKNTDNFTASSTNMTGGRGQEIDPANIGGINRNFNVPISKDLENSSKQTYTATSRERQLAGLKSKANRKIAGSIVSGVASGTLATVGAIGGAVLGGGNPYAVAMGAMAGSRAGEGIGEALGEGGANLVQYGKDKVQNVSQGIEKEKEITGIHGDDEFSNQEREAILKRNELERRGKFDKAHRVYAKKTPVRNSNENDLDFNEYEKYPYSSEEEEFFNNDLANREKSIFNERYSNSQLG